MDLNLLLIGSFVGFLLLRVPILFLLGMVPVFYIVVTQSNPLMMVPHMMHTGLDMFVLMAIPFLFLQVT